jgi:hypothetical protein
MMISVVLKELANSGLAAKIDIEEKGERKP